MHRVPMPVRFQQSTSSEDLDHSDYKMRLVKGLIDRGAAVLTKLMKLQDEVSGLSAKNMAFSTLSRR